MRATVFAFVLGAVLTGVAAGASGKTAAPAPAPSGTINVLLPTSNQLAMDNVMIPNFQRAYPNVKVNAQYVTGGSAQHISTVNTQFQSGNGPDVVANFGGSGGASPSVTTLQQAGYLENLEKQPWVKKYPKWLKPFVSVDGNAYSHITAIGTGVIIYNVDRFKSLGLTAPTTMGELMNLCGTIKQKAPGVIPLAFPTANPTVAAYVAAMFATNTVYAQNPYWNTQRKTGQRTFANTPGWNQALQTFLDLKNAGCFGPSVVSDNLPQGIGYMATGQALMLLEISSRYGGIVAAAPNTKYGMIPVPGASKKLTRLFVFPGMSLSVNAKSNNKAAAIAFVNFVARPKQSDTLAKANGYQNMAPFNYEKGIWPSTFDAQKPFKSRTVVAPFFSWPTVSTFNVLATGVQGLLTGQKSVDQVLADMDFTWGK